MARQKINWLRFEARVRNILHNAAEGRVPHTVALARISIGLGETTGRGAPGTDGSDPLGIPEHVFAALYDDEAHYYTD